MILYILYFKIIHWLYMINGNDFKMYEYILRLYGGLLYISFFNNVYENFL